MRIFRENPYFRGFTVISGFSGVGIPHSKFKKKKKNFEDDPQFILIIHLKMQ
jgi:hypothetical protein